MSTISCEADPDDLDDEAVVVQLPAAGAPAPVAPPAPAAAAAPVADTLGKCVDTCTSEAATCRAGCNPGTCAAGCESDFTTCQQACDFQ